MKKYEIINSATAQQVKEMIELDRLVFKGDDVGDFDTCMSWLRKNPEMYTVMLHDNKVVGYINFLPITDECYNSIRLGHTKDYELRLEDIKRFTSNEPLNCLFTSIVIHPDYQNGRSLQRIWQGFVAKINDLNLNITSIIMDCVTDIGEKCAITCFNAKFICPSNGGKIYEGNFIK